MIDMLFGTKPELWVVLLLAFCALWLLMLALDGVNDWAESR